MASYVVKRNQVLAVDYDVSLRLEGRHPIWQMTSDQLSPSFGRFAPLVRGVLHRVAKRLVQVKHPSVVDSRMALSRWFVGKEEGCLLKLDYDERAFCNLDLYCYDPVYDLAGAAASGENSGLPGYLRSAYESLTGEPIGEERWLLYQIHRLRELERDHGGDLPEVYRAVSRVQQRYYAETLFRDVAVPSRGPLCAIDIDGVFEFEKSGATLAGSSPLGCLTLRALTRHGYRPVLVTGRSIEEVRERCSAYRLAGGVAEYGAVLYNHLTGLERVCLSEVELADLARLRAALRAIDGVYIDSDYRYAVRAYQLDQEGRRRGLNADTIEAAVRATCVGESVRTIIGWSQTDFMARAVDKGTGLRLLAECFGVGPHANSEKPLALAVGDTVSDIAMFNLAALACAPANADAAVREAGIKLMKHWHQAGLAEAAAVLLGHHPGRCSICRRPGLSAEGDLLWDALAAQNMGKWGKLKQAALLFVKVVWEK